MVKKKMKHFVLLYKMVYSHCNAINNTHIYRVYHSRYCFKSPRIQSVFIILKPRYALAIIGHLSSNCIFFGSNICLLIIKYQKPHSKLFSTIRSRCYMWMKPSLIRREYSLNHQDDKFMLLINNQNTLWSHLFQVRLLNQGGFMLANICKGFYTIQAVRNWYNVFY